ncbi:MAG: transcriptional regulator NrdR [Peptoniphilaceae bacterium]|uniref:transcriptional regulator NrdR n=1 Tax=Parvimonas sp. TaxID=1944660 RepID=UPI0025FD1FF7|nr:transcriptional regulator NrdR [Parvimonas sp.]MCI5997983.1 transcriptional regulator NrdR [Parvimonas sp.]MDD7765089.1 transcriptional regulator NrdR [Peptoniphilaceae bacterium]MDY3051459.1 transcriptional regulator NrdR [Parvimonas sp.]
MRCPICGNDSTRVLDSRNSNDKTTIKRRRLCENCNYKFTTYERMPEFEIFVIKKDGRKQIFSRNKVYAGIKKCCEKRSIDENDIEDLISSIEMEIRQNYKNEILSTEIGNLVLKNLKTLDEVSYIRFAAVYKDFKDVKAFLEYLQTEF